MKEVECRYVLRGLKLIDMSLPLYKGSMMFHYLITSEYAFYVPHNKLERNYDDDLLVFFKDSFILFSGS